MNRGLFVLRRSTKNVFSPRSIVAGLCTTYTINNLAFFLLSFSCCLDKNDHFAAWQHWLSSVKKAGFLNLSSLIGKDIKSAIRCFKDLNRVGCTTLLYCIVGLEGGPIPYTM